MKKDQEVAPHSRLFSIEDVIIFLLLLMVLLLLLLDGKFCHLAGVCVTVTVSVFFLVCATLAKRYYNRSNRERDGEKERGIQEVQSVTGRRSVRRKFEKERERRGRNMGS